MFSAQSGDVHLADMFAQRAQLQYTHFPVPTRFMSEVILFIGDLLRQEAERVPSRDGRLADARSRGIQTYEMYYRGHECLCVRASVRWTIVIILVTLTLCSASHFVCPFLTELFNELVRSRHRNPSGARTEPTASD